MRTIITLFSFVAVCAMLATVARPAAAQSFDCEAVEKRIDTQRWIDFDTGSDKIGPKGRQTISEFADHAVRAYQTKICVIGRASKLGNADANMKLAQRRAQAVAAALKGAKVKPEYIKVDTRGEAYGSSAGNSSRNNSPDDRRVEIYWVN